MAHLKDLEELIASVHSAENRSYMREAVSCYMAGAYRACIVLTFIALFDDIAKKLNELGNVNKKARTLSQEIEKRKNEQDIFESYLLDQLKSLNLIPAIDHEFYEIVKKLRNKSAHPSGHMCSAEEARFVMYEAVSRFMKNANFSTTQACDEILANISDENFFPSNLITHTSEVVRKETSSVHEEAIPYLIEKLIDKYSTSEGTTQRNCEYFMTGLAKLGNQETCKQISKRLIEKKITDKKFHQLIFSTICSNAHVIAESDAVTISRIRPLLREAIRERTQADKETLFNHPTAFFRALLISECCTFITNNLSDELNSYLEKFPYSKSFLRAALPKPSLYKIAVEKLFSLAGSGTFATANSFSDHIEELDEILGDTITHRDSLEMVARIDDAAHTGAWSAIRLRDANFIKLPTIKAKAFSFLNSSQDEAKEICATINEFRQDYIEELTDRLTN